MKALIQRVKQGSVKIDGEIAGYIDHGLVVLLGVREGDTEEDSRKLAAKTLNLRIFADKNDRMNLSVKSSGGEILVISQFTLYADTRKGNRPSFVKAAQPEIANELYEKYVAALRAELGDDKVQTGRFGASMVVEIVNDGPVTIELCTDTPQEDSRKSGNKIKDMTPFEIIELERKKQAIRDHRRYIVRQITDAVRTLALIGLGIWGYASRDAIREFVVNIFTNPKLHP